MSIYDRAGNQEEVTVRKPSVIIPEVKLSPHTKKVMAQNDVIIKKQKTGPGILRRLREIL